MPITPYGLYQVEIYGAGLAGAVPAHPVGIAALEQAATQRMTPEADGYVNGGAGSEATMRANLAAFDRWRILPRMLRDVSDRSVEVTVCGTRLESPVLLAPVGVLSIVHDDAEVEVARGIAGTGAGMVLSTAASRPMEQVAEALGATPRWYQLYWPKDDALTASLLSRAERAGYTAIVVTLDTMLLAWRPRDLTRAYLPFLAGEGLANYFSDPVFRAALEQSPEADVGAAVGHWLSVYSDPSTTWQRLEFVREHTDLPIIVKGVLHPDDARLAIEHGADGILVSNHGGRQVDGSVGALDALPQVVQAVGEDVDVIFDSGIRTGADVFKALALGAKAVLVGRPYVWGLAVGGAEGVRQVVRGLLAEFDLTMGLSGCARVSEIGPANLTTAPVP